MVQVATDLDVAAPGTARDGLDEADIAIAESLAEQWNLGGSMTRALNALTQTD